MHNADLAYIHQKNLLKIECCSIRSEVEVTGVDTKLEQYAKSYANQRRNDCALEHSNGPYGENIFWGGGTGWKPAQAVKAWVEEVQWYNYSENSCADGQMCGHYTQIVWNTTTKVGRASVTCIDDKGTFMLQL
ncbi:unnamed protein product [Lupinus luteus]|uniref:SCP domain-containing protein n=1 Tax=Lupinus luteus TaxID=3873 RepID=A0AAV1YB89_LUPLU